MIHVYRSFHGTCTFLALQLSLTAGQTFDYETRSSFTVSFTVTDTMATTGPIDLTVNINNINEACYFDKTYYYVTLAEATVGIDLLLFFFLASEPIIQRQREIYKVNPTAMSQTSWG